MFAVSKNQRSIFKNEFNLNYIHWRNHRNGEGRKNGNVKVVRF